MAATIFMSPTRRIIGRSNTTGRSATGRPTMSTADLVFEGNSLALPSGVAADSNENFYVSSEQHNQVTSTRSRCR